LTFRCGSIAVMHVSRYPSERYSRRSIPSSDWSTTRRPFAYTMLTRVRVRGCVSLSGKVVVRAENEGE
jgi:hypothetical protein